MILDCHVHIAPGAVDGNDFIMNMNSAGIDGGVVLSLPPNLFQHTPKPLTADERLQNLMSWTESHQSLYPFFWIDPMEEDALEQVALAVDYGVAGFKVICSYFYPGDKKAMKAYAAIARVNKPILFHSGILWNGYSSSRYNRPAEFEDLLEVDGLKFALAHVSWPWCDENIAVYGKFLNAYTTRPGLSVEMFIDTTPGTPPLYREEVLKKLFNVGYDVENNIIFGTDCTANNYDGRTAQEWVDRDRQIFDKLGLEQDTVNKVFSKNLKRFLGISD